MLFLVKFSAGAMLTWNIPASFVSDLSVEGKGGGRRKAACSLCCRRVVTLVSVWVQRLLHRHLLPAAPA